MSCFTCTPILPNNSTCVIRLQDLCVYHSGGTIAGPPINTGDTLNVILQKIITYINNQSGAAVTSANNGLSMNGTIAVLGNNIGSTGATLLSNREIPMAGFNIAYSGSGNMLLGSTTDNSSKLQVTGALTTTLDSTINSVVVGRGPGNSITNTIVGASAMAANTSGIDNTVFGTSALGNNTTGSFNTGFGFNCLFNNTIGQLNVAVGRNALFGNIAGTRSVAIGNGALFVWTGSLQNTAIGHGCLSNLATGDSNTVIGATLTNVGQISNGSNNIFIGINGGQGLTTASNNVIIGNFVTPPSSTETGSIILADGLGNIRVYIPSTGNVILGSTVDAGAPFRLQVTGSEALFDAAPQTMWFNTGNNTNVRVSKGTDRGLFTTSGATVGLVLYDTSGNVRVTPNTADADNGAKIQSSANISAGVVVSPATSLVTIDDRASTFVYSGTGAAAWAILAVTGNTGKFFFIKNRGTGNLVITPATGNFYTTASVSTLTLTAGQGAVVSNDGSFWVVITLN